jgi:hypothetical protein
MRQRSVLIRILSRCYKLLTEDDRHAVGFRGAERN